MRTACDKAMPRRSRRNPEILYVSVRRCASRAAVPQILFHGPAIADRIGGQNGSKRRLARSSSMWCCFQRTSCETLY